MCDEKCEEGYEAVKKDLRQGWRKSVGEGVSKKIKKV